MVASALSLCLAESAQAEATRNLPRVQGDGNLHVETAKTFAEVVGQVTGGEVKINIHPGGSLGFKRPAMVTFPPNAIELRG